MTARSVIVILVAMGKKTKKKAAPKKKAAQKKKRAAARSLTENLRRTQESMRQELDEIVERIAELRRAEATTEDELYEEVARAIFGEHPLYYARYKSLSEFVTAVLPNADPRSVTRSALIAICFDADVTKDHRVDKLEQIALYARELSGARSQPHPIDVKRLYARIGDGKRAERKLAIDCTISELKRARAALQGKDAASEGPAAMSPKVVALVDECRKEKDKFGGMEITGGNAAFNLRGVPWEAKDDLARVLRSLELPGD